MENCMKIQEKRGAHIKALQMHVHAHNWHVSPLSTWCPSLTISLAPLLYPSSLSFLSVLFSSSHKYLIISNAKHICHLCFFGTCQRGFLGSHILSSRLSRFSSHACMHAKSLQSCLSVCDPMDCSLSMGFSRQECWSRLPCPPPGDLPDPGIEPTSLCLLHWQSGSLPLASPGKPFLPIQFPPQEKYQCQDDNIFT